jgi:hypothetical protein
MEQGVNLVVMVGRKRFGKIKTPMKRSRIHRGYVE